MALHDIVDSERALAVSRKVPDEHFTTYQRCANLFQQYPLSLISVKDMELGDAIEIFERINRGGVKLWTFDLVVASTWTETFDLKIEYEKLRDDLRDDNFGILGAEVVSQTAALILKKFCTRAHQLQITSDEISQNWKEIDIAIRTAVNHLRSNMGVCTVDFMPYPSMIALVAYAVFKSPGRSLTPELTEVIREWFWKAALTERYSASLETKLGEDRRGIMDKVLRGEEPELGLATLNEERIKGISISTRSAIRNAFFCMLALQKPHHFKTGGIFPISDALTSFGAIEKHHIFPKAYLQKMAIGNPNNIINFCFIPAELNKEISNRAPAEYFADFKQTNPDFKKTLATHLLFYDDSIKENDYVAFLEKRSKIIIEQFELLVGSKLLRDFGGAANKTIDTLEFMVRKYLAHKCAPNWDKLISKKLKEKIAERIKIEEKHTATINTHVTYLEQLRQLDVADYKNIIENNWDIFEADFDTIELMRARFNAFRKFRNNTKHSRSIDDITKNEGKAAIEWIGRAVSHR